MLCRQPPSRSLEGTPSSRDDTGSTCASSSPCPMNGNTSVEGIQLQNVLTDVSASDLEGGVRAGTPAISRQSMTIPTVADPPCV